MSIVQAFHRLCGIIAKEGQKQRPEKKKTHNMAFHTYNFPTITTSTLPKWLVSMGREAAALKILPKLTDASYKLHLILHRAVMTLKSAIISPIPTEIGASVMPPGFPHNPSKLITSVQAHIGAPDAADHRALEWEAESIRRTQFEDFDEYYNKNIALRQRIPLAC